MKNYEFWLTDDAGRRITLLKNAAFMSLSRTTMGYGTFHIGIPFRDFDVFPAFLPDRRIEVWRPPFHGATMRREGSYLLRKYNVYTRDEDNVDIIEFYGRSPIDILRRQHVSSTTLANYSKTDFIDDMMKEIVRENFISPVQTAPSGEFTSDGDESLGPSVSHSFFGQNVLDIIKELRDMSFTLNKITESSRRILFDVVEGAPLANGGFGYTFRTYADLRGTDRTGGVIFSVENGNLKSPSYYEDYLDSITQAKVLNLSTPAANGTATSPKATYSRWNTIVGAQQSSETTAALNEAKANALLQEEQEDIAFNGTFLDSPGSDRQPRSLYGVDWDLGDLLPIRYAGKNFNSEVTTVYISVNEDGKENIVGISSPRVTADEAGTLDGTNFSQALNANRTGWNGYTMVQRFEIAALTLPSGSISHMRITFEAANITEGLTITNAYIGHAAGAGDAYDFASAPVQLLFGGSASVTLAIGATEVSDWASFVYNKTSPLLIAFYVGTAVDSLRARVALSNLTGYYRAATNEAGTVNKTAGYTAEAGVLNGINMIESDGF